MHTVVDCHGHYLNCCNWYDAVMAYILLSQFFVGDKCTTPCSVEDFSWQKYGTYSTVFPTTFSSFLLKTKSSWTNFTDIAFIGWINGMWNCYVSWWIDTCPLSLNCICCSFIIFNPFDTAHLGQHDSPAPQGTPGGKKFSNACLRIHDTCLFPHSKQTHTI